MLWAKIGGPGWRAGAGGDTSVPRVPDLELVPQSDGAGKVVWSALVAGYMCTEVTQRGRPLGLREQVHVCIFRWCVWIILWPCGSQTSCSSRFHFHFLAELYDLLREQKHCLVAVVGGDSCVSGTS